ncbi:hypothetical protein [Nannocystis sp.]|uniref:hypothetical protein n=1 Tax=Nannocystis sp. TaxID=1962667 RepID=UPI0025E295A9|nr:hypothetical protein [Nannocystis sp.]MBK7828687.1 hypothetical protein [Nannocystis sp.]
MRKLIFISALVLTGVAASGSVLANYIFPGRVIITLGGGFGWGPSTLNAAAMGPGCFFPPIECECETGMLLLDACKAHDAPVPPCLTHESKYLLVDQQDPPVLLTGDLPNFASLRCSGLSNDIAKVIVAKP